MDIWCGVTPDLECYDPDAVSTANGPLNLKFDALENHLLNYRSGMVQSWNELCVEGVRMEGSISLPDRGDIEGFRYSYWDRCDAGITVKRSPDGLSLLPGMRLPQMLNLVARDPEDQFVGLPCQERTAFTSDI